MIPRLLVTDLDGTLVGDDAALARFRGWLARHRGEHVLAYATGRHWPDVASAVASGELPAPDAVIAAVGTEVLQADGRPWAGWAGRFHPGHGDLARGLLATIPWLEPQGPDRQTALKASYLLPPMDLASTRRKPASVLPGSRTRGARGRHQLLCEVHDALAAGGITARLVVSADRYLDVLPVGSGKGAATRFLVSALGIEPDRVLVFGDSGNDAELLLAGYPATVVANAQPELAHLSGPTVYRSRCGFADGILDGITHWTAAGALPRGLLEDTGLSIAPGPR